MIRFVGLGQYGAAYEDYVSAIVGRAVGPQGRGLAARHGHLRFRSGGQCGDTYVDGGYRLALLESKSSMLRPIAKYAGIRGALEDEMRAKFVGRGLSRPRDRKGVTQMVWCIKRLLSGEPVTAPGIDARHIRYVYPVIVCNDPAMACPMIPVYLSDEFQTYLDTAGVDRARVKGLCVLTTRELELLERICRDVALMDVLDAYMREASPVTTFWNFATASYAGRLDSAGTLVDEHMIALRDEVASKLRE